jgi:threonine dehydratase
LTEPAASCCLAAADQRRDCFRPDDQVVLVLCGGNVATADLAAYWNRFAVAGA